MNISNLILIAVVIAVVLAVGAYFADQVKENPDTMTCTLGVGPAKAPKLCYGWQKMVTGEGR